MKRPFYTDFGWAYDSIILNSSTERIYFIEKALMTRGIKKTSTILDAGCGTGNYSIALAKRGYSVIAVDIAQELLHEAQCKVGNQDLGITFVEADILNMSPKIVCDAILCRGVLNDLTDVNARKRVFASFADLLKNSGVLIFDVRNWETSVERKTQHPIFEKSVITHNGRLTFRSVSTVDRPTRSLFISESHILERPEEPQESQYDFTMTCWTTDELNRSLSKTGFVDIQYFGDYDIHTPVGTTDRIVAVATLQK